MNPVFQRFFEENRKLLVALGVVLVGNVAFYLLLSAPTQLRARGLRADLVAAESEARDAIGDYGRGLLETRLMESAQDRIEALYDDTLQTSSQRFATVDAAIKSIAKRFKLAPHAINYGHTPLISQRVERLDVTFNLKGNYDNLRNFIEEIEGAKQEAEDGDADQDLFFALSEVRLSDSTDRGTELNLNIVVSTYFHKPELAAQDRKSRKSKGKSRGRRGQ